MLGVDLPIVDQIEAIRAAIEDIARTCGLITVDISDSTRINRNANQYATDAERALDNAERALNDVERRLRTDGERLLRELANALGQDGQESDEMTRIARDARDLADRFIVYFHSRQSYT